MLFEVTQMWRLKLFRAPEVLAVIGPGLRPSRRRHSRRFPSVCDSCDSEFGAIVDEYNLEVQIDRIVGMRNDSNLFFGTIRNILLELYYILVGLNSNGLTT